MSQTEEHKCLFSAKTYRLLQQTNVFLPPLCRTLRILCVTQCKFVVAIDSSTLTGCFEFALKSDPQCTISKSSSVALPMSLISLLLKSCKNATCLITKFHIKTRHAGAKPNPYHCTFFLFLSFFLSVSQIPLSSKDHKFILRQQVSNLTFLIPLHFPVTCCLL